jgi:hypothetical protein
VHPDKGHSRRVQRHATHRTGPAGTARQLQRALSARQSCRSARAASRGSAMSGQRGCQPREAELKLRWCRTKGRKGRVAELTLRWCRTRAERGQAPKGRAVAQPVPHKGQQKGQAPRGRTVQLSRCRTKGSKRGKPREGELSSSAERQNNPHERVPGTPCSACTRASAPVRQDAVR